MSSSKGSRVQGRGNSMGSRIGAAICALTGLFSPGLCSPAPAQPLDIPYLVRDIADAAPDPLVSSYLQFEAAVGGRALFWAASGTPGSRWTLWSTDGTSGGTSPISDLLSYEATSSLTSVPLCVDSDRWIFWPGGERAAFWSTDGTAGGTSMVTPLSRNSRPSMSYPERMPCEERRLGGRIHFWTTELQGLDGPTYDLWSTDGTFDGTQRVAHLGQDLVYVGGGLPDFIRLGDKILFSLQTAPNGFELWRTDGTEAGTAPFLSQLPGTQMLMARGFARVGDWAFFVGFDPGEPFPAPLAVTDGTAAGTRVFEDLFPVEGSFSDGYEPVALSERLVVAATSGGAIQLWGVSPLEINPEVLTSYEDAGPIRPLTGQPIGNHALFVVTLPDPPHGTRSRLLISDGTAAGTMEVAVGCDATGPCGILGVGTMGSEAYFSVFDASGLSLWKSDGTGPGTVEVRSVLCVGGCGFLPFGSSGAKLYLRAVLAGSDQALWVTDGTPSGTFELLPPGPLGNSSSLDFNTLALPGDGLLFGASDPDSGYEPWITNGTPSGTHMLVNLAEAVEASKPTRFSANGDRVLFAAQDLAHGEEPWVSGGMAGDTKMVVDIRPGEAWSSPLPFRPADGLWPMRADPEGTGSSQDFYYTTGAPGSLASFGSDEGSWGSSSVSFHGRTLITSGAELIAFDGNPPAVNTLAQIGAGFDAFPFLAAGAHQVYFRNLLGGDLHELWSTDGSTAGTSPFCDAPDYQSYSPGSWIGELSSGVVFKARTAAEGVEAYFCHAGETAILLADIATGAADSDPEGFIAVGGWSLFAATDAAGDRELWRTDGTVAGTSLLANLSPPASSAPAAFHPVAGGVLFTADDGQHGRELWFSDGTAAGTAMLADLAPGPMSSQPADFEPIGGAVVFAAETLAAGRELWVTAGTPESTGPLPEIRPGPLSSRPEELTATQHRLFFRATDERGAELWALCPSWVAGTSQACNQLFADGFESGSVAPWSASTP